MNTFRRSVCTLATPSCSMQRQPRQPTTYWKSILNDFSTMPRDPLWECAVACSRLHLARCLAAGYRGRTRAISGATAILRRVVGRCPAAVRPIAQLLASSTTDNRNGKQYEREVMAAVCCFLAKERTSNIGHLFRHIPKVLVNGPRLEQISGIDLANDVDAFPLSFDLKNKFAMQICSDDTMRCILQVGNPQAPTNARNRALVFQPTAQYNVCADFVVVLPAKGSGRLLLLFQCKDWASSEKSPVGEFRYGRQYMEKETVVVKKGIRCCGDLWIPNMCNKFLARFSAMHASLNAVAEKPLGPTHVVYALATVVPPAKWRFASLKRYNLAARDRRAKWLDDEGTLDVDQIASWCPSVAYASQLRRRLRKSALPARVKSGRAPPSTTNRLRQRANARASAATPSAGSPQQRNTDTSLDDVSRATAAS